MESLASYAAVSELRRVDVPVLVVQGDRDTQATVEDAELLRAANPRAELVVLAGATHVFKPAELAGRVGELAMEMEPRVPILRAFVERIAEWVRRLGA
jgi:hypothetical protein